MTVHQQDSSQPQQSHDSPHLGAGVGLTMVETEEATLAGIVKVLVRGKACGSQEEVSASRLSRDAYPKKCVK